MKQVLITGGSRGIGAAAVRAFAAQGHRVAFFYARNAAAASAVAAETGAQAICCDVADDAAVHRAVASLPPIDLLINNAGISSYGLLSQLRESALRRLFEVNVGGVIHCCNAVTPAMLLKKSGCIINIASMWGQTGASCEAAYSATKGAVIALTKALAKELGPSGIRVNCVSPGVIATDMLANLDEQAKKDLAEQTPLGTIGTPQDVAQALLYLAGAEFVTGQNLAVNGGFVL